MAEPGGLADGVAAPRSAPSTADVRTTVMAHTAGEPSKYYPGHMVDATAGTQYATGAPTAAPADSPAAQKPSDIEIQWDTVTPMSSLVTRYLFAFAGVLTVSCLLAHAYKPFYVPILLACLFVSGLLLPIMDVAPKQRDDSDDIWLFVGLTMVFGPSIGLIFYAVMGFVRQTANPAVVGCFIVSTIAQAAIHLSAAPTDLLFGPPWVQQGFNLRTLFVNWCAFASLLGWASANLFHRFDE